MTCVDQIESLRVKKVMIAQIACNKGITAKRDRLRNVITARTAADRDPMNPLSAVAVSQSTAA